MAKTLVAYFSATGRTAKAAELLADTLGADIHEIQPRIPYTRADLNWLNKKSRSSVEMNNKAIRPEISESNVKIEEYQVIFLGFPIWWYVAPTIVNSFLEGYDFSGKTLVLFATSGGSGFGNTEKELKPSLAEDTRVITWKVLSPKVTEAELAAELSKLAL